MTRSRAAFVSAVALQLVVLYLPRAAGPAGPAGADKAVHALVFALAAWTGRRAGVPTAWLGAALLAHAPLSELVQHVLLPRRSGEAADIVADLCGVAVGLLLPVGSRTRSTDGAIRR